MRLPVITRELSDNFLNGDTDMSRKKGFKVKRSRRNLYKRRKSTGRKIFEGVLFVVILGALVFVGYSVASPLIKFFS